MKTLTILGLLFLAFGIWMTNYGLNHLKGSHNIKNGVEHEAQVLSLRTSEGPRTGNSISTNYDVKYSFEWNEQTIYSNWRGIDNKLWQTLKTNDPITIFLNPENPEEHEPSSAIAQNSSDAMAGTGMGIVFALFGGFLLYFPISNLFKRSGSKS
jgi:hypothetical protein